MVIKFAARADLHHLGLFLAGRQADAPQEALQVLDIVLRELPTHRYVPILVILTLPLPQINYLCCCFCIGESMCVRRAAWGHACGFTVHLSCLPVYLYTVLTFSEVNALDLVTDWVILHSLQGTLFEVRPRAEGKGLKFVKCCTVGQLNDWSVLEAFSHICYFFQVFTCGTIFLLPKSWHTTAFRGWTWKLAWILPKYPPNTDGPVSEHWYELAVFLVIG